MNLCCAFCGKKIVLGYCRYLQVIEYFRMNIEYLWYRFALSFLLKSIEFLK
jgi:hypothetical protein